MTTKPIAARSLHHRWMQAFYAGFLTSLILLSAGNPQVAKANGSDSVGVRVMQTTLLDGTIVRYIWGPVELGSRSSINYVKMSPDTTGAFPNNFLKTVAFQIGSNDTIEFSRFCSFDSSDHPINGGISTSTQLDSLVAAWRGHYNSREFHPSSSYWNSASTIRYVVELRRASDDSVLWNKDTTSCYLNGAGHLRFQNYPKSYNMRFIFNAGSRWTGITAYFCVRSIVSLPTGSTLSYIGETGFTEPLAASPAPGAYTMFFSQWQEGYPAPPPPKASGINVSLSKVAAEVLALRIQSNPVADGVLGFAFDAQRGGMLKAEVVNVLGKKLKEATYSAVNTGVEELKFDVRDLSAGTYFLQLYGASDEPITAKFQIAK